MGQLIHQDELRAPDERRVEIEFSQCRSTMLDHARRQNRQPFQQSFRFHTTMCFDPPNDDVHPVILLLVRRSEHGISLPHTGHGAEKDLELAARLFGLFSLYAPQQGIRIWSSFFHQMCAIGDTEFSADWNVRISVEEMPESVNESSCRFTTTRAQLIVGSGNDRASGSLSHECPAQDSTSVH